MFIAVVSGNWYLVVPKEVASRAPSCWAVTATPATRGSRSFTSTGRVPSTHFVRRWKESESARSSGRTVSPHLRTTRETVLIRAGLATPGPGRCENGSGASARACATVGA